jgi:hypothetical protein
MLAVKNRDRSAPQAQDSGHFDKHGPDNIAQLIAALQCVGNIKKQTELLDGATIHTAARARLPWACFHGIALKRTWMCDIIHAIRVAACVPSGFLSSKSLEMLKPRQFRYLFLFRAREVAQNASPSPRSYIRVGSRSKTY